MIKIPLRHAPSTYLLYVDASNGSRRQRIVVSSYLGRAQRRGFVCDAHSERSVGWIRRSSGTRDDLVLFLVLLSEKYRLWWAQGTFQVRLSGQARQAPKPNVRKERRRSDRIIVAFIGRAASVLPESRHCIDFTMGMLSACLCLQAYNVRQRPQCAAGLKI